MVCDWLIRIIGLVDVNALGHRIHIPNDGRPSGEIVRAFFGHLGQGDWSIVILAADLGSEVRRAFNKAH